MSFSNSVWSGILALGLASSLGACGSETGFGEGGIPPLGGEDAGLPNTPRNRFDQCFPPDQGLAILLDGRGAVYGNPPSTPVDGGSAVTIDRATLCFAGEACNGGSGDGGAGGSGDGGAGGTGGAGSSSNQFRAVGRWASAPLEFYTQNPGDPGYGLMATRTGLRANGDPLSVLRRSGMAGTWAEQFPGFLAGSELGFIWSIDGDFDAADCRLTARLRGAVRSAGGGMSDPRNEVPVPIYSPRLDGKTRVASSTFNNEALAILSAPIQASLAYPTTPDASGGMIGAPTTVCNGTCSTVPGSTLDRLEMRLVVSPFSNDAGPGDAGTADAGAPAPDAGASDGGIPPLSDAGGGG